MLRFREGQRLTIDVRNDTATPELVHWHGLLTDPRNDGAMEEGSPMIAPGETVRYALHANPPGSRWYHTHAGAGKDLRASTYSGQFGFFYIEPRHEPGQFDREVFLPVHHWEPKLLPMGPPMNAPDVRYRYATFNSKLHSAAEPLRVRQGERVLFRFLNASGTQNTTLALPGHLFTVVAMDGNAVPQPAAVETISLAVGERVDAVVEMNTPGVWLLGSTDKEERESGLGLTVEYAQRSGKAVWIDPEESTWDYLQFGNSAPAPKPDVVVPMIFAGLPVGADGLQHWTVNGKEYPDVPPLMLQRGLRYRLSFVNGSAMPHPLHLHRHSLELVSVGGRHGSGLLKDVVNIPANSAMEVDVVANNPGDSLFHCHQQLHMDYGFMQLFRYAEAKG